MQQPRATTLSAESIDLFRSSLCAKGRSELTAKAYTTDLKVLLNELETDEIPAEEFEDCGMNWLTANRNKVSAKTTNRRLTTLRQFSRWARWGFTFDEYTAPTALKGQPHPLPEGIEGVMRLIEVAENERYKALIALCGLCGLRIGEALSTPPTAFDLSIMKLLIRGKGDKERIVPVSDMAWEVLQAPVTRAWINQAPFVVGMQDRAARAGITRLGEKAGLKRSISSHDLRATFATEVYNKTKDQRLVQYLLGHASGATTEIYIGRSWEQLREGVQLV